MGIRGLAAAAFLLVAGCHGAAGRGVSPSPFTLPDSVHVLDGATGAPLVTAALLRLIGGADIVLLGEVHDNATGHAIRGALIDALGSRRPAVVFEQFAAADSAIAKPVPADSLEGWLDRSGFDRRGWRWPLHQPVVAAAVRHGRSLWGSGVSRENLRAVVRGGEAGAPDALRRIMERTPLDSAARAVLDRDLVEGHCGQLPESQIPGMRAAQVVRDASMTRAINMARAGGTPVWLVAGNGHVRKDVAVPRLLAAQAPDRRVLVVGTLEHASAGAEPPAAERRMYDVVIVTPRAAREDPCRQFTAPRN
jgi:uncharacterized iron-regulated protein